MAALRSLPSEGPFDQKLGKEDVRVWPEFSRLDEADQATVNSVSCGTPKSVMLIHGSKLHLVSHEPEGEGSKGYTIQSWQLERQPPVHLTPPKGSSGPLLLSVLAGFVLLGVIHFVALDSVVGSDQSARAVAEAMDYQRLGNEIGKSVRDAGLTPASVAAMVVGDPPQLSTEIASELSNANRNGALTPGRIVEELSDEGRGSAALTASNVSIELANRIAPKGLSADQIVARVSATIAPSNLSSDLLYDEVAKRVSPARITKESMSTAVARIIAPRGLTASDLSRQVASQISPNPLSSREVSNEVASKIASSLTTAGLSREVAKKITLKDVTTEGLTSKIAERVAPRVSLGKVATDSLTSEVAKRLAPNPIPADALRGGLAKEIASELVAIHRQRTDSTPIPLAILEDADATRALQAMVSQRCTELRIIVPLIYRGRIQPDLLIRAAKATEGLDQESLLGVLDHLLHMGAGTKKISKTKYVSMQGWIIRLGGLKPADRDNLYRVLGARAQ